MKYRNPRAIRSDISNIQETLKVLYSFYSYRFTCWALRYYIAILFSMKWLCSHTHIPTHNTPVLSCPIFPLSSMDNVTFQKGRAQKKQEQAIPHHQAMPGLLSWHSCTKTRDQSESSSSIHPSRVVYLLELSVSALNANGYLWKAYKTPTEAQDWHIPNNTIGQHPGLNTQNPTLWLLSPLAS